MGWWKETIRQEEFELMLLPAGLRVKPNTLQYLQTLNQMKKQDLPEESMKA